MSTDEGIVRAMVDTYNARDPNRFVDCFAPDAVTLDGLGNQTIKGHEGMRKVYGRLFDQSPKLHAEIKARMVVGKYVVTEEQVTGMNLEGHPSEAHMAIVYRVEDGKITRVQMLQ